MLNRIINRIREPEKSKDTPPTSPSRSRSITGSEDGESETTEGFICPTCMQAFPSVEVLQDHYGSVHSTSEQNGTGHSCPVCKMKMKTMPEFQNHFVTYHCTQKGGDLETMKQEIAQLQTTLREEKWYSEDLKKEVEKLQATYTSGDKDDIANMYKQQLKALEESKSLLTSEIVLLRKQLAEAVETNIQMKQEKDKLEQKAALMAQELAGFKADSDQQKSQLLAFEKQLEIEKETVSKLEIELQQRPEADDVSVLRQELIQVQTLMDDMSRQRELEKETLEKEHRVLQDHFHDLKKEKENLEEQLDDTVKADDVKSLKDEISAKSAEIKQLQTTLHQKSQENLELETKINKLIKDCAKLEDNLANQKSLHENIQLELTAKEEQIDKLQAVCIKKDEQCSSLQLTLDEMQEKFRQSESDITTLQETLNMTKSNLQQQLLQRERSLNDIKMELEKITKDASDKDSDLTSVNEQLTTLRNQFQEQIAENEKLKNEVWQKQSLYENECRQRESSELHAKELEEAVKKQKDVEERLEAERNELYAKIEAGEGANTAIQQLTQEKNLLQEKTTEQQRQMECQAKENVDKINSLHLKNQELKNQLKLSDDQCLKLKSDVEEAEVKFVKIEEKVSRLESALKSKTEEILKNESSHATVRSELETCIENLKTLVKSKEEQIAKEKEACIKLKNECTEHKKQLQDLNDRCASEVEKKNALQKKFDSLKVTLQEKMEVIKKLECDVENLNGVNLHLKTNMASMEGEIEEAQRLQTELVKLANERNDLEKKLHDSSKSFQERIVVLTEDLKAAHTSKVELQKELAENKSRQEEETKKTHKHMKSLEEGRSKQSTEIEALSQKVLSLDKENILLNQQLVKCKKDLNASDENWKAQESLANKLSVQLKENEETINSFTERNEFLTSELKKAEEALRTHADDLLRLRRTHEETVENLRSLEKQMRESQAELSEVKKSQDLTLMELEESRQNEATLTKSLEDLNQVKSVLGQQMLKLHDEFQKLSEEKTSLEKTLSIRENALSEIKLQHDCLTKEFETVKETYNEEKTQREKAISNLETTKEILIKQKLEIEEQLNSTEHMLAEERKCHIQTKEVLQTKEKQLNNEKETLANKLHSLEEVYSTLQEQKEQSEARYEMQLIACNENLSTLRADIIAEQNKSQDLEKERDELSGDKLELEAKLDNALDERRALLERCLGSEAECEKLHLNSTELRHKLDDALAAIHELGRENQTLQIENVKVMNRKWADDSEVTSCSMCQKLFSVTVRKHHCRNCGNIFCHDCSTRTAAVASSKKPVRVCDLCFAEISK